MLAWGCIGLNPAVPLAAQDPSVDDPAVLTLVRKAQELRQSPQALAAVAYRLGAEGHIYFYLDRDDGGASIPMRVDQVAVDLYQDPLGRRRQVIRGLRKRELLLVKDFHYYIDRLTAVQNGFGDMISIGEGRDVRDVPHPLGSNGEQVYRYQIVDSIRLTVPSLASPLRVYEVEVQPRNRDHPGFVGSVFIEAETGALVRMVFSFTPASYVDRRTDRITVRLEHSLWDERWWLPYRQVVDVRREMPELDLPVGSVIRATLEVLDYEFNPVVAPEFFARPTFPLRPVYGAADSTVFRDGLMDGMAEQGLSPVNLAAIEAEARRVAQARLVSGLPRVRVYADRFSSVVRANRAEGVFVGLGASYVPGEAARFDFLPGYATADGAFAGRVRGQWMVGEAATATVSLHGHQLRDAEPFAGASGAVNTASVLLRNYDYSDPWFATGASVSLATAIGNATSVTVSAAWEEMSAATTPAAFGSPQPRRPLRPVQEGAFAEASGELARRWQGLGPWTGEAALTATAGAWDGAANATVTARFAAGAANSDYSRRASLALDAGAAWGSLPYQRHFLLGGRGTLPGHPYRAYGGRRFVLARAEAGMALVPGWLSARVLAGAGAVGATPPALAEDWQIGATAGLLGYAGAGLGVVHDIVRIDGLWGLPGGAFEVVVSLDPRLRPYL